MSTDEIRTQIEGNVASRDNPRKLAILYGLAKEDEPISPLVGVSAALMDLAEILTYAGKCTDDIDRIQESISKAIPAEQKYMKDLQEATAAAQSERNAASIEKTRYEEILSLRKGELGILDKQLSEGTSKLSKIQSSVGNFGVKKTEYAADIKNLEQRRFDVETTLTKLKDELRANEDQLEANRDEIAKGRQTNEEKATRLADFESDLNERHLKCLSKETDLNKRLDNLTINERRVEKETEDLRMARSSLWTILGKIGDLPALPTTDSEKEASLLVQDIESRITHLSSENGGLKGSVLEKGTLCQNLQDQVSDLQANHRSKCVELSNAEARIKAFNETNKALEGKTKEQATSLTDFEKQLALVTGEKVKLAGLITNYEAKSKADSTEIAASRNLRASYEVASEENESLRKDVFALREANETVSQQIKSFQHSATESSTLQRTIRNLRASISAKDKDIETKTKDIQAKDKEYSKLCEDRDSWSSAYTISAQSFDDLKKEKEDQNESHRKEIDAIKAAGSENTRFFSNQKSIVQGELDVARTKLETLQLELNSVNDRITSYNDNILPLQQKLTQDTEQAKRSQEEMRERIQKVDASAQFAVSAAGQEADVEALRKEVEMTKLNATLERQLRKTEQEIADLKSSQQVDFVTATQMESLKAELRHVKEMKSMKEGDLNLQLEIKNADTQRLNGNIESLKRDLQAQHMGSEEQMKSAKSQYETTLQLKDVEYQHLKSDTDRKLDEYAADVERLKGDAQQKEEDYKHWKEEEGQRSAELSISKHDAEQKMAELETSNTNAERKVKFLLDRIAYLRGTRLSQIAQQTLSPRAIPMKPTSVVRPGLTPQPKRPENRSAMSLSSSDNVSNIANQFNRPSSLTYDPLSLYLDSPIPPGIASPPANSSSGRPSNLARNSADNSSGARPPSSGPSATSNFHETRLSKIIPPSNLSRNVPGEPELNSDSLLPIERKRKATEELEQSPSTSDLPFTIPIDLANHIVNETVEFDTEIPARVLDHLRKQIPDWQSVGYLKKRHPKNKATCADRSLHKQKSTWSHGYNYACDACQELGVLCVTVRDGCFRLLPRFQKQSEETGPEDLSYWMTNV